MITPADLSLVFTAVFVSTFFNPSMTSAVAQISTKNSTDVREFLLIAMLGMHRGELRRIGSLASACRLFKTQTSTSVRLCQAWLPHCDQVVARYVSF